ncbi:POK18 protein, partial [Aegithalos caudatus]|nr:POK18 protein [Aegithalos caudatus]
PWKYLGYKITEQTITPQRLQFRENPKTLNEMQQLVGTINWIRPLLGITNQDLHPLF